MVSQSFNSLSLFEFNSEESNILEVLYIQILDTEYQLMEKAITTVQE